MTRWIRKLVVLAVVLAGVSLAQVHPFVEGGSTLGIGFGPGGAVFDINMGAGAMNIAGPFGIRGQIGVNSSNAGTIFTMAAGALFSFGSPKRATDLEPYVGVGFGLESAAQGTAFGLLGIVGLEFPINPKISFYSEFVPGLYFLGNGVFVGNIKLGMRGYF
jgi:hypothetical protein